MESLDFGAFAAVLRGTDRIAESGGMVCIYCTHQEAVNIWERFVEKNNEWRFSKLNYELIKNNY